MCRRLLLSCLLAGAAAAAHAHDYDIGPLHIGHPWARPTAQGQSVGGAYLEIDNQGDASDTLLGVSGDVAADVQVHRMQMDGNVMRMREAGAIQVPAHGTVKLAPGGVHIMLMRLKSPLKAGQSFPLTLHFRKAGEVRIEVKIESAMPAARGMKH